MRITVLFLLLFIGNNSFCQIVPHSFTFEEINNSPFPYAKLKDDGPLNGKLNDLRKEILSWVENGDVVGNELLILKQGNIIFHESFGWSDIESKKPVKLNSIWSIRSMTKPITATSIMLLVEDGKLSLDDKVINYIPNFKGYPETTIGHLISHTSGYSKKDFGDYDSTHQTLEDWMKSGSTKKPTGTFGAYEYTDFGFVTSAYIVQKITGEPLGNFIEKRIIEPLELTNTRVNFSDDPHWRSKISTWYILNNDEGKYEERWPANRPAWKIFGGAWGMFSTTIDYAKFLSSFLSEEGRSRKRLLNKKSIDIMTSPHGFQNNRPIYGYGWMIENGHDINSSLISFGHYGGDALFGYVFPQEDLIIVYMNHSRGGSHAGALVDKLRELDFIRYGQYGSSINPSKFDGNIYEISEEMQKGYTGIYRNLKDEKRLLEITSNNGIMSIHFYQDGRKVKGRQDLVYVGNNDFLMAEYFNGKVEWIDPKAILRFNVENGVIKSFDFIEDAETIFTAALIEN